MGEFLQFQSCYNTSMYVFTRIQNGIYVLYILFIIYHTLVLLTHNTKTATVK